MPRRGSCCTIALRHQRRGEFANVAPQSALRFRLRCARQYCERASQSGRDFRATKTIEITGVIKSVSWRNPHGQILLSVKDDKGARRCGTRKRPRSASCATAARTVARFVVGDRVTIAGSPSMRNRPEILARSVLLPSGYEFTFGSAQRRTSRPARRAASSAARKIEGDVAAATARADGLFRVWSTNMSDPAAFPMFKGGYPLDSRRPGRTRASGTRATTCC